MENGMEVKIYIDDIYQVMLMFSRLYTYLWFGISQE